MVKTSSSEKLHIHKCLWNEEVGEKMSIYASKQHGAGGQRRSGKSSRERWSGSNLKADARGKSFTPQEEELVIQLHAAIGSRWPIIAQQLPGKTETDVKILWNSKLRKKLSAMGIDPVTHKPFSQILADYGNIGAFPKARTRFSSLSRDLKNAIIFKSEQQQLQQQQQHPQTNTPHHHHHHLHRTSPHFAKTEYQSDHLYSQLQAINLVTEASSNNYQAYTTENVVITTQHDDFVECCPALSSSDSPSSTLNQEISSFSWSDFLLEDAFRDEQENNTGTVLQYQENTEAKQSSGGVEDEVVNGGSLLANSFEAASSSSTSFVDAMIETQDQMFSQVARFYDEPFYF